ncbi:MAG: ATP-grasp domain-containing protein [Sandaracinaceae bacterium]|nr:ATP-grasp domain-containing protein [Sandaracinaceae bacterium]
MHTFRRLFIANRGEVALRIARSCEKMGIVPVFGVSSADANAPYLRGKEAVVLGPGRAEESYLDPVRLVQAAKISNCSALHPGWGFLSENPLFASLCEEHGLSFVGPPPHAMALMGKKSPAKKAAKRAGLRLIPGSDGVLGNAEEAKVIAKQIGYPVLLKAESGGGGRGMRVVRDEGEMERAFEEASQEAKAAFGDPSLYLEKLIEGGRHVEIQILADRYGNVVHLGERDCTVQRKHQKLIEESPCPVLDPEERERAFASGVRLAREIGYVSAGTIEFLLDDVEGDPKKGVLRFIEMNTRLQVEHPVTEMRTGIDLVSEMIRVAAGHRLNFSQSDIRFEGHAIECRINAEDPFEHFRPSPGRIQRLRFPDLEGGALRIDTHIEEGYVVPPYYDSLIAKVIAWGRNREEAIERMVRGLSGFVIEGVATTIPMHLAILQSEAFRTNRYDTGAIPGWPPDASRGMP